MRTTLTRVKEMLALAILAAVAMAASAQAPKIEQVIRAGLPSGQGETVGRTREGTWMPLYVKINAGPRGCKAGEYRLIAEAPDAEETSYRNTLPVPALGANEDYFAITYLRATGAEFQVWLVDPDGREVPKSQTTSRVDGEQLRGDAVLCLAIGGFPPAGLRKSLVPAKNKGGQPELPNGPPNLGQGLGKGRPIVPKDKPPGGPGVPRDPAQPQDADGGEVVDAAEGVDKVANSYAFIGSVQDMPDHWHGYDAVDVIFLVTDSDQFLKDLLNAKVRRQALVEWVRRGGKLVVSVGRKAGDVSELLQNLPLPEGDKGQLIDCDINFNIRRKTLPKLNTWAGYPADAGILRDVDIAKLVPGRGTRVLLTEPAEPAIHPPSLYAACGAGAWSAPLAVGYDPEPRPLIVDSACGLGRVMLVAFDLDARPFTGWPGQEKVWDGLRTEMAPGLNRFGEHHEGGNDFSGMNGSGGKPFELIRQMRNEVETFGDVPTVHFGWVALFIAIYIAIVGPLDYLLLAKVFKRLELTWLTFPAVVLTLSIAAYFGAYALKGDKRRFNKMDVVEIDLGSGQAFGTTWFGVFSPRIENYTLGVEPALPGKAMTPQNTQDGHSAVVTILESQGLNTLRSRSVFDRPYEYAPAAAGLKSVPIPVWSVRSFTGSWRTPLPDEPPILATGTDDKDINTLVDRRGTVSGHIKNNLPVTLRDIYLIYHGKVFHPQESFDLAPGASLPVIAWGLKDHEGQDFEEWQKGPTPLAVTKMPVVQKIPQAGGFQGTINAIPLHMLAKEMLFFPRPRDNSGPSTRDNSVVRHLDQSWRLREVTDPGAANATHYLDEVMLIARTDYVAQDNAQDVNQKSLVRLWVGDLPKANATAPAMTGQTTENTFIRVYIPVRPRD